MPSEDDRFHLTRCRYVPKNVEMTINENLYSFLDGSVTYMNIMHQYIKRSLPVIQMGIEMDLATVADVYKNRDVARIKLDIVEETMDDNDQTVGSSLYLQHTFSIIPRYRQDVYLTTNDLENLDKIEPMRDLQHFETYLIDMDAVEWFRKEMDINLDEASYPQMLLIPFLMRGVPIASIGMITPPHQGGPVKNVTAPIGTLVSNIRHMNDVYGFYRGDPLIYYDLRYMYCIHKQEPNIVLEDPEDYGTVVFMLANPDTDEYQVKGYLDDDENETHWVNLNREPRIENRDFRDITTAEMSTLASVNGSGKVKTNTISDSAATLQYVYSKNDLTEEQYLNESLEGPPVSVVTADSSVRFIKPFKDFRFSIGSSYKQFELDSRDVFRVTEWSLSIRREGRVNYRCEAGITLVCPKVTKFGEETES